MKHIVNIGFTRLFGEALTYQGLKSGLKLSKNFCLDYLTTLYIKTFLLTHIIYQDPGQENEAFFIGNAL